MANSNIRITYPHTPVEMVLNDVLTLNNAVRQTCIEVSEEVLYLKTNCDHTRTKFRNRFLEEMKKRNVAYDVEVLCDRTFNTKEVVDENRFVAAIIVKPKPGSSWLRYEFETNPNQTMNL